MIRPFAIAAASACLAASFPARANVLWRGDFETGDLSQWSKAQLVSSDRAQVVDDPVAQGRHALRVLVRQGDNPIGASGNRNELVYLSYEPRGTERWYRWQTRWDPSYPSAATWQLFTQWHQSGDSGSPPVEFYVYAEEIRLRVNASTIVWTAPLVRGVWHDFVLHVRWSPDPSEGFVELWFDGQLALPRTYVQNQFPGMTNYLKQGLYRSDTVTGDGIVFHDGFTIGETEADVRGSEPSSPDAGVEPPAGPDAANPAGPDAAESAGPDAAESAGPDAAAPAGPDASEPEAPDAVAPAGPDAGEAPVGPDAALAEGPGPDAAAAPTADADPALPGEPATGCSTAGGGLMVPALALIVIGLLLMLRSRKE